MGEKEDDLQIFNAEHFANAIMSRLIYKIYEINGL